MPFNDVIAAPPPSAERFFDGNEAHIVFLLLLYAPFKSCGKFHQSHDCLAPTSLINETPQKSNKQWQNYFFPIQSPRTQDIKTISQFSIV